jgi:hypothetical protein
MSRIALRARCWAVTRSDLLMDYRLEDRREVLAEVMLQLRGQSTPAVSRVVGHKTALGVASATSSVIADKVSLV